jgi:hypothetical protein
VLGVDAPRSTPGPMPTLLGGAVAVVTLVQLLLPGVNQDVRYVVGALDVTGAAGLSWAETWAHRPLVARWIVGVLAGLSPGTFWMFEGALRFWSMLMAAGAAWLLWRGLRRVLEHRVAAWVGLATGAALAWAPGWDFAEPEWYATVLAVAAVGVGLRGRAAAWPAGVLLAVVTLVKYTTAATALVALMALIVLLGRRRSGRRDAGITTAVAAAATLVLFGLTVLIEPREWQWLMDMPTLNPGFQFGALPDLVEGLANSLVVSPVTAVALITMALLLTAAGRRGRRLGWLTLGCLVVLAVPFVVQQQSFLYHLSAVPVAAAALVAGVAASTPRLPLALPATGVVACLTGIGLFALGPRTRDQLWWVAVVAVAVVIAVGLVLAAARWTAPATTVLIALACLVPLLVTVSPRTAYSYSLAHHRTTAPSNLELTRTGTERQRPVQERLPQQTPVIYLSFAAPYWVGNPTPCRYASPTFLQRATGVRGDGIARTASYADNLACLSDPAAEAVVIEPGWFGLDRVRPEVRATVAANFDCGRALPEVDGLLICPRR